MAERVEIEERKAEESLDAGQIVRILSGQTTAKKIKGLSI
jgi:hypothetical protein